ncbi:g11630 [Coccomyxa elongata]
MRVAIRRCLEHAARTSRWSSTLADVKFTIATALEASEYTGNLEELSRSFHVLPPVSFLDEATAPTALQWLRRRGPPMSEGARRKLLRQRRMRLLSQDSGELRRVSQSALLPQGARLLVPKDTPADQTSQEPDHPNKHAHPPESHAGVVPKHIRHLEAKLAEHMQRRVLHMDAELLVLDKPAGLPVQGGDRIHVSLDSLLPHLRFDSSDTPRLVHRLDRNTSGALVVARTADAATWLSQAFRLPAEGLSAGQLPPVDRGVPFVEKRYQAVVEDAPSLRDRGSISARLPGHGGSAAGQPAVTGYEVLARSAEGFAWLALQPVTGRKHQLRQVCAEMGVPIVGDGRYGRRRSPAQQRLDQLLREAPVPDQDAGAGAPDQDTHEAELDRLLRCDSHLLLHCCRIVIHRSSKQRVDVVAPPSQHMQRVLDVLFRDVRDTLPGGRRISGFRAGHFSSMPSSRGFSSNVGNSRCTRQLFGAAYPQAQKTTAGPCSTIAASGQMVVTLRRLVNDADSGAVKGSGSEVLEHSAVNSQGAEHAGSPGATTLLLTDTKPGPRPPPLEIEPEEGKSRWSWARKRAAKIERQKDAAMKKLKKKWKEARKHRRGRQRSILRHTGHKYVGVALDGS